jgi:hypothetical protein
MLWLGLCSCINPIVATILPPVDRGSILFPVGKGSILFPVGTCSREYTSKIHPWHHEKGCIIICHQNDDDDDDDDDYYYIYIMNNIIEWIYAMDNVGYTN